MRGLLLVAALLAAATLLAALDGDSGLRLWSRLRSDLEEARGRQTELSADVTRLELEREALREDPFAGERAVREELLLARPDEILIRLPDEGGDGLTF